MAVNAPAAPYAISLRRETATLFVSIHPAELNLRRARFKNRHASI
jgi:hypothetical protein